MPLENFLLHYWKKTKNFDLKLQFVEITLIYSSVLISLNKFENTPVVVSPPSSYFSVLHFLSCFQSLSEKAAWNGFLEMINVFLNVCSLMLLES